MKIPVQVADVKSAVGSVLQMVKAGNRVHFERDNCYIENVRTGKRTLMQERNGAYEIGVWIQSGVVPRNSGFARQDSTR